MAAVLVLTTAVFVENVFVVIVLKDYVKNIRDFVMNVKKFYVRNVLKKEIVLIGVVHKISIIAILVLHHIIKVDGVKTVRNFYAKSVQ